MSKNRPPADKPTAPTKSPAVIPPSSSPPTRVAIQSMRHEFSGPLPAPTILAQYGEVQSDFPERILRMAEKQAEHRQQLERSVINADIRRAYLGVVCAFLITLAVTVAGFYLILTGHSVAGTIFAGLGVVSLAGTFIYGTQSRKEERQRREQQNRILTGINPPPS